MKNVIFYISLLLILLGISSCEQEMEIYNAQGNDRLNFYYADKYNPDTLINYTFIYCPEEQMTDTIWFDLETSGFLTDYPRTISFEQLKTDGKDAEAGKHYVAFDDPSMKEVYVVPANSNRARIPLIMKKDDPELKNSEVTLKIKIKENEFFKSGSVGYQIRTFKFTNMIIQPKYWDMYAEWYFAGEYGPVKYQFMIDAGAEIGVTVDDDFFYQLTGDPGKVDMGLTGYWQNFFAQALADENAERAERGEGPLREAPKQGETEGKLVTF